MRISDKQMTLGDLIKTLKRKDPDAFIQFDFVYFVPDGTVSSYRGYYEDFAIGYASGIDMPTVGKILEVLEKANGETFYGYKGGEYTMDDDTPVWVAKHNESGGTCIIDVVDHNGGIMLRTEKID